MSVVTVAHLLVSGDDYEEIYLAAEKRISEFFDVDVSDVKDKFNYEILVKETEDMESESFYQAQVVVRSRDV
jgi:hypothetical protein